MFIRDSIKYGASYASVTANQYFDVVKALGSDEVEKLKKNGTGKLSKELIDYKDSDFTGKANDVFATINIKLTNETEESYKKALVFVNNPVSYTHLTLPTIRLTCGGRGWGGGE